MLNKTNNTKNSIANKYSNIIKGLENIFEKIKKELITKKELSQDNFKVWEEKNQHLVHGFAWIATYIDCLLYTSPSPRDRQKSRMPSSA